MWARDASLLAERGYKVTDSVILFDGQCNLCNNAVNYVLDHDITEKFRFAALQSEVGHALLRKVTLSLLALPSPNEARRLRLPRERACLGCSESDR